MAHHNDIHIDDQYEELRKELDMLSEEVKALKPHSSEFVDFKFLWDNKEKIIRNKKLIDLLG